MCAARALPIIQLLSTHRTSNQETIILRFAALCPARWQLLSITVGDGHLASSWPKHVTSQGPRAREAACHHVRSPYLQLSSSGSRLVSRRGSHRCLCLGWRAGGNWLAAITYGRARERPAAASSRLQLHITQTFTFLLVKTEQLSRRLWAAERESGAVSSSTAPPAQPDHMGRPQPCTTLPRSGYGRDKWITQETLK